MSGPTSAACRLSASYVRANPPPSLFGMQPCLNLLPLFRAVFTRAYLWTRQALRACPGLHVWSQALSKGW